jgi:putative restriction endonuclease
LTLVRTGTNDHKHLLEKVGAKRWGVIDTVQPPVKDSQIIAAESVQAEHEAEPLNLFDNAAATVETRTQRIARSVAFQKRIVEIYQKRCAVCGEGLLHPKKRVEIEAAHIVPRRLKGADDARNGLALCRTHHWAFDNGLFGIKAKEIIFIPNPVKAIKQNKKLADLEGKIIIAPTVKKLTPSAEALEWHLSNIVVS